MHSIMLFSVLDRAVSEELLMRSFDLSYNYGILMIWQNNFITQLSDNSLSPFSLQNNGYRKDDHIVDCSHLIEKMLRKTQIVDFHRG